MNKLRVVGHGAFPWAMIVALLVMLVLCTGSSFAQISIEQNPIEYFQTQPDDPITRLQKQLDAGEVKLEYDKKHGYLESVLKLLNATPSSQVLVYSKTSFQLKRIGPLTPRAIYYGDEVYMGWVKGGDVMEFSAVDTKLGANFYTLSQEESDQPKFTRHTHECLQCHGSTMSRGVPGHMVRSVYPAPDGHPMLDRGSHLTDPSSPFKERWGGWYVSGTHGDLRHLGNLIVRSSDDAKQLDLERGANCTDLSKFFSVSPYLKPHSDIVSLMVLEHQALMHNVLTQSNFLTRIALRDQRVLNEMLGRPEDHRSETTALRLRFAADPVVKHLLFVDETPLTSEIRGGSSFVDDFSSKGVQDSQGRSLRTFDLKQRLFKYPCSYLIDSDSFELLPGELKEIVYQKLWDVLTGKDQSESFQHLSDQDRRSILEILKATKDNLPDYWTAS